MTPREKYNNDPDYCALVKMMVHFIEGCKYTPSEMREAAVLASIIYEQHQVAPVRIYPDRVMGHLQGLQDWLDEEEKR